MHVCVMHISTILHPWLWCMCVWYIYLWYWTLTFMYVCMMHISMVLDLDPEACMYVWFLTLMYVCMCDAYICSWSWYTWPWCTYVWCMMHAFIHDLIHACMMHYQCSQILDSDTCVYDAYIYSTGPWSWSMHICMILDPGVCMHVRCIYMFLILTHVTMMHIPIIQMYDAFIQDAWSPYRHVWCVYLCSLVLDSDACMYGADIYDPGPSSWSMHVCMVYVSMMRQILFRMNGRTRRF